MIIKILGKGCANCLRLEENARTACRELNLNAEFVKVKEIEDIMAYGVMSVPCLVVDEKLLSVGKVLKVDAIKKLLNPEPTVFSVNL